MKRREFLKSTCALGLLATSGMTSGMISSCASLPIVEAPVHDGVLRVPVELFSGQSLRVIRGSGLEFDIALERRDDGTYRAFLMECTHAHNPLMFNGTGFICPLHGSRFDENGMVTHGPASLPLTELKTRADGTIVAVSVE